MTSKLPNLLPLDSYTATSRADRRRTLVAAIIFFAWNLASKYLVRHHLSASDVVAQLFVTAIFVLMMIWIFNSQRRSLWTDYFYDSGKGALVESASESHYVYQLPCLHASGVWRDTGILFFSAQGLRFVARRGFLRRPRPIEISPLQSVTTRIIEPPRANWWIGGPMPNATSPIEISWSGGKVLLWTPDPNEAAAQINRAVETLLASAR